MYHVINKLFFFLIILVFTNSCESLRSGLEGNKKSKSAEEFLIKKKNPLVLPPEYSKLPRPTTTDSKNQNEEFDLEKILKKNSENSVDNSSNNSSFKSKLKKIINNK